MHWSMAMHSDLDALIERLERADPLSKGDKGKAADAIRRLVAELTAAEGTLGTINKLTSPGTRTFDEMMNDTGHACDMARARIDQLKKVRFDRFF
jgi:hypothetical protein